MNANELIDKLVQLTDGATNPIINLLPSVVGKPNRLVVTDQIGKDGTFRRLGIINLETGEVTL